MQGLRRGALGMFRHPSGFGKMAFNQCFAQFQAAIVEGCGVGERPAGVLAALQKMHLHFVRRTLNYCIATSMSSLVCRSPPWAFPP